MLGYGVWRISGYAQDMYFIPGGLEINVVVARAAQRKHADTILVKNVYRFRIYRIVYKGAYAVAAARHNRSVRIQLVFKIFQFKTVFAAVLVKPCFVVWLRVVKSNFFHGIPSFGSLSAVQNLYFKFIIGEPVHKIIRLECCLAEQPHLFGMIGMPHGYFYVEFLGKAFEALQKSVRKIRLAACAGAGEKRFAIFV